MLILISPAKTLDFDKAPVTAVHSEPRFLADSRALVKLMRDRSPAELASMMSISDKLAELNHRRFAEWKTPFRPQNAKQAVLAFRGDVYTGLEADTWSAKDFEWAQQHLRILSGLYGVLRPLDLIQAYRLEMGTRVDNPRGSDLYAFWKQRVTASIATELEALPTPLLVNLASNEYIGAVDTAGLPGRVLTPVFEDLKNGRYRIISFFAKRARGAMASWIIRNRVRSAAKLKDFDGDGYRLDADAGAEASAAAGADRLVFRRAAAA